MSAVGPMRTSFERQLMAESGSSNRWIFSGTKDRYTSEAAIHILVAEYSVRTSASPPKAAAELISLPGAADDPLRTLLIAQKNQIGFTDWQNRLLVLCLGHITDKAKPAKRRGRKCIRRKKDV